MMARRTRGRGAIDADRSRSDGGRAGQWGCRPRPDPPRFRGGRPGSLSAPNPPRGRDLRDTAMANGDVEAKTSNLKGKTSVTKNKAVKEANQRLRKAQRAAILLKQASDPTRLQIILTLADGEKHVGALCD